jgi:class 3 adenylate cyclase/pimeloyl-ACP methyl ester carboxylesterase
MEPRIQYARTADGVSIAFFTEGEGMPFVALPGMPMSNVQRYVRISRMRETFEFAVRNYRLVAYDRRGFGLSQRDIADMSLDALVLDIEAVADQLALDSFVLFAPVLGGALGIAYAVRHPDRVSHLVLANAFVSGAAFWQLPRTRAFRALREADWDTYAETIGRFGFEDPNEGAAFIRESATPETARMFMEATEQLDTSGLLSQVKCPTLVVYQPEELIDPGADAMRGLAAGIPGASLVIVNDVASSIAAVQKFIEGERTRPEAPPAVVAPEPGAFRTILFTDVEGSTALTQRLGDERARALLREHERAVRECLKAHGGSEVKTMGDGFMASFASATKALECAIAIQRTLADRDAGAGAQHAAPAVEGASEPVRVRIGLNAGEPIAEGDDLFGTAVIAAARVAAQAQGGEILASNVVRELVAGKGFMFSSRGKTALRGFDDPVEVYEVRWQEGD